MYQSAAGKLVRQQLEAAKAGRAISSFRGRYKPREVIALLTGVDESDFRTYPRALGTPYKNFRRVARCAGEGLFTFRRMVCKQLIQKHLHQNGSGAQVGILRAQVNSGTQ